MNRDGFEDVRGRRSFLRSGTLMLAASRLSLPSTYALEAFASEGEPIIRFGLITDLHYADKPPAGTRFYQETPRKLEEAAGRLAGTELDFLVELGDFIDAADSVADEMRYLKTIQTAFATMNTRRYYVLGNHCVDTLTKDEFLHEVGQERSYFSFDQGKYHFIVLDACFRQDGQPYGRKNFDWTDPNLPDAELAWLQDDLAQTPRETLVFVHQRLDVGNPYGIKNAPAIRRLLEESGKVRAVFQGHSHKNDFHEISGIPYVTLVAMVEGSGEENNAYAVVEIAANGTIQLHGFRRQQDYIFMQ